MPFSLKLAKAKLGYRKLDIVSLFLDVAIPHLVTDLQNSQKRLFESSMNGPTPDVPIQDIFALYRRTSIMLQMHKAFVSELVFLILSVGS